MIIFAIAFMKCINYTVRLLISLMGVASRPSGSSIKGMNREEDRQEVARGTEERIENIKRGI